MENLNSESANQFKISSKNFIILLLCYTSFLKKARFFKETYFMLTALGCACLTGSFKYFYAIDHIVEKLLLYF